MPGFNESTENGGCPAAVYDRLATKIWSMAVVLGYAQEEYRGPTEAVRSVGGVFIPGTPIGMQWLVEQRYGRRIQSTHIYAMDVVDPDHDRRWLLGIGHSWDSEGQAHITRIGAFKNGLGDADFEMKRSGPGQDISATLQKCEGLSICFRYMPERQLADHREPQRENFETVQAGIAGRLEAVERILGTESVADVLTDLGFYASNN